MPNSSLNIQWSKFLALLVVCMLLVLAAFSSYSHLRSLYFDRAEENLKSQMGTLHQSLSAWGRSKRNYVFSWSRQPEITRYTQTILANEELPLSKLSRFALGDYLRPAISDPEIIHFYLVGPGNNVIASDNTQEIGLKSHLMAMPYLLNQAWGGMSVITYPVQVFDHKTPSIYVAAPIKNATSDAIALLVLEIDPTISFNEVFKKFSFAQTGEAYAFDRDGFLLTPGRDWALTALKQRSMYGDVFFSKNVATGDTASRVLDHNLDKTEQRVQDREPKRTRLAAKIGDETSGIYVHEQFVGHDGHIKIGAWVWDSQFHMGLAIEQSAEEGLKLLLKMQWVFLSFIVLVLIISLGFFFILSYWAVIRGRKEALARQALVQELEALHESNTLEMADREAKHRAIIDTAWDAIFTVDSFGIIQSGNPATSRIFGCTQHKLIGHLLEDSIWLESRDKFSAYYLAQAVGQTVEAMGIRRDHSTFPVAVSIGETQTSQATFYTVIVRDISRQKASEDSLLRAQRRLEMSQSFAYIGTWEWDVLRDSITATEMALKLNDLECSESRISLGVFFSRIFPADRTLLSQEINKAIVSQKPFSIECRIQRGTETLAAMTAIEWLLVQGTPLVETGSVTRVIGHIQQITKSKASEQALEKARNMLRLVLDTIPTGVYWKNTDLKIAGVNKRYCEDIGLMASDIIGKTEGDIYENKKQAMLVECLDRTVVETGIARNNDNGRYYMNDGSLRHIEISRLPIHDEQGNTLGVLGVYSDISERLETQQTLQQHHRLLASIYTAQLRYFAGDSRQQIFATLLDEILSLTKSEYGFIGQVLYKLDGSPYLKTYCVNDLNAKRPSETTDDLDTEAGLELYDLDILFDHVLTSHKLVIRHHPQARSCPSDFLGSNAVGNSQDWPKEHPVMASMNCFMGIPLLKGDELVGMIGIAHGQERYEPSIATFLQPMFTTCSNLMAALESDAKIIATQKQLLLAKNSAEQANRAKTEFLSRVSHELRTPMNAILGFADLLSETVQGEEPESFLGEIEKAGGHLMSLINEVLDLERIESGRIELQLEHLHLNRLIDECYSVTAQLAAQQKVSLVVSPDNEKEVYVLADSARLRQILLNLISNGIKYNRPQGQVLISVHTTDDARVCITVEDTGVGLTKTEQEHLFESFNRLHAESSEIEGTGMGLVITRHLVELMAGVLLVESDKGIGSRFIVSLPLEGVSKGVSKGLPKEGAKAGAHGSGINHLGPSGASFNSTGSDERSLRALIASPHSRVSECCPELETQLINYDVEFSSSGIEFLESCLQKEYELLIYDVALTDFSVEELLGYLLDAQLINTTPLLFVSDALKLNLPADIVLGEGAYRGVQLHRLGSPAKGVLQRLISGEYE